jgi:uncharacterized protein
MKRFLVLLIALLGVTLTTFAARYSVKDIVNVQLHDESRYTSNPDNILSAEAVAAIDRACDSLHTAGKAQIAVVAVENIEGDDLFTFAHELFSSWGVGGEESDNGLGIILVTELREIRFVTGYGLEGILPDALCRRIQQRYMFEHLAAGDYSAGMVNGVAALASVISSDGEVDMEGEMTDEELLGFMVIFLVLMLVIIVISIYALWQSKKCPKCGKHCVVKSASECLESNKKYDLMQYTYRCSSCGFIRVKREKIYKQTDVVIIGGAGRGIGGGGFSGGFGGGFGGGSFGGGGAGMKF